MGRLLFKRVAVLALFGIWGASANATNAVVATCDETHFNTAFNSVNGSGSGTITFSCSGTITFSAYKQVSGSVVIDGAGTVTFDGGGTSAFFQVFNSASLTLKGLTLQHSAFGGVHPLENFGSLVLDTVTLKNNSLNGAIVYNNGGDVVAKSSTFSSNDIAIAATSGELHGTAIRTEGGTVNISASTFDHNVIDNTSSGSGGAIYNNGGDLQISTSTFTSNTAYAGGAISNDGGGTLHVAYSTFTSNGIAIASHNSAGALDGGAIWGGTDTSGIVHVAHSTFTGNSAGYGGAIENFGNLFTLDYDKFDNNKATNIGGAIWNEGGNLNVNWDEFTGNTAAATGGAIHCDAANLYIGESTFSANKSNSPATSSTNHGGAIFSHCTLVVVESTFYNNTALGAEGGAIYEFANIFSGVYNSTLVSNQSAEGAAVANEGGTAMQLSASIFALNTHGHTCAGSFNSPSSPGYNLADDTDCGGALSAITDKPNVTLSMGALADNGGPTRTMLPLPGNPAINNVPTAQCSYATDQRGALRLPSSPGGKCDSGAVEVGGIIDEIFADGFEFP